MKCLYLFCTALVLQSCFLFGKFKKDNFSFTENSVLQHHAVVVPKKFAKAETLKDSAGNEIRFYAYAPGSRLYFALMKDTSVQLQPIQYGANLPKDLYNTYFFKGIDSNGNYWRETRAGNYRAGYYGAAPGEDWKFDSAINYFTLHSLSKAGQ